MYQSSTDGAVGIPLAVMGCIIFIYYVCSSSTRKVLISIWWWLCPAVFGFCSFIYFGDIWGAVKTALVSIFWVGIPGGIMLGYLGGQEKNSASSAPSSSEKTVSGSQLGGSSKYIIGFIAILICFAIFVISRSATPKILLSDAPAPSIGASINLPADSTLSDSKDSEEPVTQAADKPPEAKEQTSNASSKQSGLGLATGEVLVTGSSGGSKSFSPEQEAWLGKADRTDPYVLARMRSAVPDR
jgi:hypothetical protein